MRTQWNIPTEVLRAVVEIAAKGSLTKAADSLGLSQPAISSQIKRIEQLLGEAIFHKSSNGSTLTEIGKLVLLHAKKALEANEQILALGGTSKGPIALRIGLCSLLARQFFSHGGITAMENYQVHSSESIEVARELIDGLIDVGCFFNVGQIDDQILPLIVEQAEDELAWVRSLDFVLSPGSPLPIILWNKHEWLTDTLQKSAVPYRIVFSGQDYDAKRAAVESGAGVTVLPSRSITGSLVRANEYYLPKLPSVQLLLGVNDSQRARRTEVARQALSEIFFQRVRTPVNRAGEIKKP